MYIQKILLLRRIVRTARRIARGRHFGCPCLSPPPPPPFSQQIPSSAVSIPSSAASGVKPRCRSCGLHPRPPPDSRLGRACAVAPLQASSARATRAPYNGRAATFLRAAGAGLALTARCGRAVRGAARPILRANFARESARRASPLRAAGVATAVRSPGSSNGPADSENPGGLGKAGSTRKIGKTGRMWKIRGGLGKAGRTWADPEDAYAKPPASGPGPRARRKIAKGGTAHGCRFIM